MNFHKNKKVNGKVKISEKTSSVLIKAETPPVKGCGGEKGIEETE